MEGIYNENKKKEEKKRIEKLKYCEGKVNYRYNENLELVDKITGKKCGRLSQQEYDYVGFYVKLYVENLLIEQFELTTLYVPNNNFNNFNNFTIRDESQAQCKILTTNDFPTNPKCLILIQGTGPVRLGQWSRSVCINENLLLGSMFPYVDKAIKKKYSVIIFNPNERLDINDRNIIAEFDTMENHCIYVYNNIVKKNTIIKEIYIVAHSMGGECTVQILIDNKDDLLSGKIKKIAFIDSVHRDNYKNLGKKGIAKFKEISRNYIGSKQPAGTFLLDRNQAIGGVDCFSSGHKEHEYTSGCAIKEVFKFFKD